MSRLKQFDLDRKTNGNENKHHFFHKKLLTAGIMLIEFFKGVASAPKTECNLGADNQLPAGQSFEGEEITIKVHNQAGTPFTIAGIQAVKDFLNGSILTYKLNNQQLAQFSMSKLATMFDGVHAEGTDSIVSSLGLNPMQIIDIADTPHDWPEKGRFEYILESSVALGGAAANYKMELLVEGILDQVNASQVS